MKDSGDEEDRSELLSRLVGSAGDQEGAKEIARLESYIKLSEEFSGIKFKSTDWEVKHTGRYIRHCDNNYIRNRLA